MIWHLVAAFVVGVACAGIALFLRKISGKRLPKWIIPAFAGIGMLTYQIHTEYDWFEHKKQNLPAGSVVVSSEAPGSIWRPWTYLIPMTTAFTILDTTNINSRVIEGQKITEFMLYRFEKQHVDRVKNQGFVLNCASRELFPFESTEQGERKLMLEKRQQLAGDNTLYREVCI